MILSAIWEGNILFRTYTTSGLFADVVLAKEATRFSNRMINRHGNFEANRQVATVLCRVANNEQRWKLVMSVKVDIGLLL